MDMQLEPEKLLLAALLGRAIKDAQVGKVSVHEEAARWLWEHAPVVAVAERLHLPLPPPTMQCKPQHLRLALLAHINQTQGVEKVAINEWRQASHVVMHGHYPHRYTLVRAVNNSPYAGENDEVN